MKIRATLTVIYETDINDYQEDKRDIESILKIEHECAKEYPKELFNLGALETANFEILEM